MSLLFLSLCLGALLFGMALRELIRVQARKQQGQIQSHQLLKTMEDPREAAVILMVQASLYGSGQITLAQKERITSLLIEHTGCDQDEAEGLFSYGRMAVGQLGDAADHLSDLLRPIKQTLTLDEMKALIGMMLAVVSTQDASGSEAMALIEKTAAGLKVDLPVFLRDQAP